MVQNLDAVAESQNAAGQRDSDPIKVPDDDEVSDRSDSASLEDFSDEDDVIATTDPLHDNTTRVRYNDHNLYSDCFIDRLDFFEEQLEVPLKKYYSFHKGRDISPDKLRKFRNQCRQQQANALRRIKTWKQNGRVGHEPLPTQTDSPSKYGIFFDSDTENELDHESIKIIKRKKKGAGVLKRPRPAEEEQETEKLEEATNECSPSKKQKTVQWSEWVYTYPPPKYPERNTPEDDDSDAEASQSESDEE
ncbi:hypothetical protein B0T21DRAFT_348274 [Apiosordaria backusii]|uniref:Uncharacterized protein n=1 Tax=Apiosordaria backusii TaxID=314023 RepID=A0AA40BL94_9PEZI|nr:hypothetical protein B0T21DRAFT_348274 [Apiosordaria backusii]